MDEKLKPLNCGAYMKKEWGTGTMEGICAVIFGGGTGQKAAPALADELAPCPVLSGKKCVVSSRSAMNEPYIQEALKLAQQYALNTLTALNSEKIESG